MSRLRHRTASPLGHEPESFTSRQATRTTIEAPTPTDSVEAVDGQITIVSGAHIQQVPLAGMSIAQARVLIEQLMSIQQGAPPLVNGQPVEHTYTLHSGDTLEFVHHAGEKGWHPWTVA